MDLVHKEISYDLIGACFDVYNTAGQGLLEAAYHECLEIEFSRRGFELESQKPLPIFYKQMELNQRYIADFVIEKKIIIEIKAVKLLADEHRAQLHNYLKATRLSLGLLVNFGHKNELQWERIVN